MILNTYATLRDLKTEAGMDDSTLDADDVARLLRALRRISARIEELCNMGFAPRNETRYLDAKGTHINEGNNALYLDAPLLEIISVTDGTGASLVDGTDFVTMPRSTPYLALRMLEAAGAWWTSYTDEWRDAVSIVGVWGYRQHYADAWIDSSDTVQDNPLTASATTITVADADGSDAWLRTPRFSAGQLLKIETEYIAVVSVDEDNNVLTVVRGVNGSTAASHAQNTAISIWEVEPVVLRAATRWAAYLSARRGAFERARFDGIATVSLPSDAPEEVLNILRDAGLLATSRRPL